MSDHKILDLPKHVNPSNHRAASAPYNFVPLPEVVVTAVDDAEQLPKHDTYTNTGYPHTGYFDVTLTTKSPLYVRCPFTRDEFDLDEQDKNRNGRKVDNQTRYADRIKNTPDFFYTCDRNQPVIPGSSLRGMLRGVLEVVSFSKVQWVTDKKLFFRTVDNSAVGLHYRDRMVGRTAGGNKVEAGFLRQQGSRYFIKKCPMARVRRDDLSNDLYERHAPNRTPRWNGTYHQYRPIWVQLAANGWLVERLETERQEDLSEARLVITGDMSGQPGKQKEFVFLIPADDAEEISVPEELIDRFHDDDQITQWQELAFPKDKPNPNCRERSGMLRRNLQGQGDPVFFLREDGQLTFFGRAQMFRLPYTQCPLDLVKPELRHPEDVDYADALFGFVCTRKELDDMKQRGAIQDIPKQGDPKRAYASRVFVTDAMTTQTDVWMPDNPIITPKILATPKPTAFQHYLTQQEPNNKDCLDHYGSPPPHETVIRGHKRYWHQGLNPSEGLRLEEIWERIEDEKARLGTLAATSSQHTRFKPVKPEVQFKFRVHFENLSDEELGALCWTLHPLGDENKIYCHSLGMGKPLGMGAVKLDATLHLTNRTPQAVDTDEPKPSSRYEALFSGDSWCTGEQPAENLSDRATLERLTEKFEKHLIRKLVPQPDCQHLSGLKRIAMLLKMMEWPTPERPDARYMMIQGVNGNEYKTRPVLPDPSAFGTLTGYAEPTPTTTTTQTQPPTETPNPPFPPPAPAVVTEPHREWVTLLSDAKNGKAQVRPTKGAEEIPCTGLPYGAAKDDECRADVMRENGKAVNAIFKGWE